MEMLDVLTEVHNLVLRALLPHFHPKSIISQKIIDQTHSNFDLSHDFC